MTAVTKRTAGPKAAAELSLLPAIRKRNKRSLAFDDFARNYFMLKTKTGPLPLKPRKWQLELVDSVFNPNQPRLASWMMPRGQGKSALCAGLATWELFEGQYGADIVLAAVDEGQSRIIFDKCVYAIEHSPELSARPQIFRDKILVPGRAASLSTITSEERRIQGLDFSLAFLDEAGFADNRTFASLLDSQGKREQSTLLLIGTPGTPDSPLERVRADALTNPNDPNLVWREFSAAGFEEHSYDCPHCLEKSNPALGDFLHYDAIKASMPPRTLEGRYRKVRLCQFVGDDGENYLSKAAWDACRNDQRPIKPHTPCCLGLDGSRTADDSALVLVTIEETPRMKVLGHWSPQLHDADYRIPHTEIMQRIRDACRTYDVKEVACDPYGFAYAIEVLTGEGLPMVEFPNSNSRMAEPTSALRDAVHNKEIEHDGDPVLAQHVLNAVVSDLPRGVKVSKPAPKSARKIDLLAALLMGYDRARWNYNNKPVSNDWYVF